MKFFDETVRLLTKEFKYARYKPLEYYEGEATGQEIQGQVNLARFMKILTVKRLESSFTAFRQTLGRFIATYGARHCRVRQGPRFHQQETHLQSF